MEENQYPDEDEEYELRFQDELAMLDQHDRQEEENIIPNGPTQPLFDSTKCSERDEIGAIPDSPHLSQISYGTQISSISAPVNRRLFGTPKDHQRMASTPVNPKVPLQSIKEVIAFSEEEERPTTSAGAFAELQNLGLRSKRRLERDLFGDIRDLYDTDDYEDPLAKKARCEKERDEKDIERILEARRRQRETSKTLHTDNFERLQKLHEFKMKNLSYTLPKWSCLALQRSDDQRVYVRFHSEEYETRAINDIRSFSNQESVLGERKQEVWAGANEIVLKRTSLTQPTEVHVNANADIAMRENPADNSADFQRLWVEKYKPRKYVELLSDEMTNRSLLYWLKMWDKVVFGREFNVKQKVNSSKVELNSFNKRTGKFESNGGWRQRKPRQTLDTNIDELGRPVQKVALLCGPPGLGKTTLAHTIARHAGYAVREINASDDRTPEAFKLALENGTQMSSVLDVERRPNCIILDEVDGAPKQSIEYLVKFVSDNAASKGRAKGSKAQKHVLKRPIICICNDVYDSALRPLRQIAFVVTVPPVDSARLADRLMQISRSERLKTDFGALIALAEKSGNDVRSCISTMQFFKAQKKPLTLRDVLNSNLGQKDRHQGLFDVWSTVFRIQRSKKQSLYSSHDIEEPQGVVVDTSLSVRARNVLDVVHAGGDYERLTQGVYENYLHQRMPDSDLIAVTEAMRWFCFTDELQHKINHSQNYSVYPYLQIGFVAWHFLFATLAWPKINFPTKGFEFNQKTNNQRNIFQALRKGITCSAVGIGQGKAVLLETVPYLKRILSPNLRSVAVQLLSAKEQYDLRHTVDIMVDLGLAYIQVRSADGHFQFQLEPNLDELSQFSGSPAISLTYFARQLIAREVELERMRRSTPKTMDQTPDTKKPKKDNQKTSPQNLPNHLQRLKPKRLDERSNAMAAKDVISKDFFGRIQHKTVPSAIEEAKTDPIVKSPIWYRYKEGFNNAVRRDVHLSELL